MTPIEFAKRLYVGNLYYELKENDIRNFFAPFGAIHSIDLSMEPGYVSTTWESFRSSQLTIYSKRTGRSKGFCFLEFDDVLAAESAVQVLNGSILANRTIKVRPCLVKEIRVVIERIIGRSSSSWQPKSQGFGSSTTHW